MEALDAGQLCSATDACVADLVSRGIGFGVVLPLLPRLLHRHAAAVWSTVAAECADKVLAALATVAELATSTALPRCASSCVCVHAYSYLCFKYAAMFAVCARMHVYIHILACLCY